MPFEKNAPDTELQVLLVDDEQHCIDTLRSMLKRIHPEWTSVKSCNSAASAKEMILRFKPRLVFLDVEMPHQNGFDLLTSLQKISFDIIFTTAYEHYAIKAIKFNALDYLLKPFSLSDLEKAIQKFLEKRNQPITAPDPAMDIFLSNLQQTTPFSKKIALSTFRGLIFVPLENIIRCEAKDNYSKVYITDGSSQVVSKTLKEFEYLLEDMNFFRVHYSHLINLQHVQKYVHGNGGYVLMSDGSSIEVSRRRKPEFLKKAAAL
jgi:two-component system LytT family response regulator